MEGKYQMRNRTVRVVLASLCLVVAAAGCSNDSAPPDDDNGISARADAHPGRLGRRHGRGLDPARRRVVLTNTTEQAFAGTRSLKTTGPHRRLQRSQPEPHRPAREGRDLPGRRVGAARLRRGADHHPGDDAAHAGRTARKQFDTIAQNTNVTDGAWVTLNRPSYSFSTDVTGLLLYVEATSATASYYIDAFSLVGDRARRRSRATSRTARCRAGSRAAPSTLTNTTEQAFAGTRSLKTTGRTAGFNGPSRQLVGQLTKGATYEVTVSARLVTGTPATTVSVTMQRTPTGGSTRVRFDRVRTWRSPTRPG